MITQQEIRTILNAYLEGDHLSIDEEQEIDEILGKDESKDYYRGELEMVILLHNFLDVIKDVNANEEEINNARALMRKMTARLASICID